MTRERLISCHKAVRMLAVQWRSREVGTSQQLRARLLLAVAFGIAFESAQVAQAAQPPHETETIETHLYALKATTTPIPWDPAGGGAIAPLRNDLLLATPYGSLSLVRRRGDVVAINGQVPMGLTGLLQQNGAKTYRFRVTDILLKAWQGARYRLFVTHLYFTGSCIRFRLSSTTVRLGLLRRRPAVSPSWKTIFDAEPCLATDWHALHESGGKMLTDGDEHLLVTVGSFAKPVQSMDTHFGKLLRINTDTGAAEVVASGLRNAQGLARDRGGNLWETEHGPQGGDELNVIKSGTNYGWGEVSYGVDYGHSTLTVEQPLEQLGRHDGFTRPAFAWVPSIGITSIVVNDERFFPLWKDDLLIGSLRATSLFRVRRHGGQVSYVERIRGRLVKRIRDIAQLPDGRVALLLEPDKRAILEAMVRDTPDADSGLTDAVEEGVGKQIAAMVRAANFDIKQVQAKILFLSRTYAPYCGSNADPRDVYAVDCPN